MSVLQCAIHCGQLLRAEAWTRLLQVLLHRPVRNIDQEEEYDHPDCDSFPENKNVAITYVCIIILLVCVHCYLITTTPTTFTLATSLSSFARHPASKNTKMLLNRHVKYWKVWEHLFSGNMYSTLWEAFKTKKVPNLGHLPNLIRPPDNIKILAQFWENF